MAEELLSELETAALIVLGSSSLVSPEQRKSAEDVFLNFRETKLPYQLCQQILELSTTDYILFETVGLIKRILVKEWGTLKKSDISLLRQYLLHYVISRPTLAQYVKTKIFQVFAIIVKKSSVDDSGLEKSQIIDEIENLIKSGNLTNQILGCSILSAILQEFAITAKTSNIGLTWEQHYKQKDHFEKTDIKKIFKFCIEILDELIKKDVDESTLPLLKNLISIVESILTWGFICSDHFPESINRLLLNTLKTKCETNEIGNNPSLQLSQSWQDLITDPALLDLFFTLYWKVRGNPQLAHHSMNCLIQLASLYGPIMFVEDEKTRYLTNYIQRFLKLIVNIEIGDQEANGITIIMKKINFHFQNSLMTLPEDLYNSFIEQITRLTCQFIECAAKEDSMCVDNCLYMEAMERMLEIWSCMLYSSLVFPSDFCKKSFIQIFNIYLQYHLSPPEGLRNSGKSLTEEVEDVEDDDKVKYKEQLQIIGTFGRKILDHSLPLLARLLEDRIQKLRDNLNVAVEQKFATSLITSMNELYEDLHWLILITGHVLCMESEGETALIPIEITRCSMKQSRDGNIDVNRTLEFLVSSQDIQSDISCPVDSCDRVIRLITSIFRLCTFEKTAVSISLEKVLSPEMSSTIVWFLRRWSKIYFLPNERYYSELSTTLLHAFGEDGPGAVWSINFLLDKVICNINAFRGESSLIDETIKLLICLVSSRTRACCLSKSEQFKNIIELAMKVQYDFPQVVKRGLMRAVVEAGSVIQNRDQYYWSRTLEPLQNRFTQLISSDNFMSSYHEESIKIQIIDILESCIGAVRGTDSTVGKAVYQYIFPILAELPKILSLYHNYQNIVQLILELFNDYTRMLMFSSEADCKRLYGVCMQVMQTYTRCNNHRFATDSTAEEDSFQDILLLMRLSTHLLIKDIFKIKSINRLVSGEVVPRNIFLSVFLYVFVNMIMPMMTMNLLKFPSFCLQYFRMITFLCDLYPEEVYGLSDKALQQLLASVELGLYSFGNEIANLCCDTIQALAKHIYKEVMQGLPRKDIMAPFLNLLMSLILSHQMDSDVISNASMPLYHLMYCYREQYHQLKRNIISAQTDLQTAERLINAFNELIIDIDFNIELDNRLQKLKFTDNFEKFVVTVQGFLTVK